MKKVVIVTGAGGYVGQLLVRSLANQDNYQVLATDLRCPAPGRQLPGVTYAALDVRDPKAADLMKSHGVDAVVHLAAVVTPKKGDAERLLFAVDVQGTENIFKACAKAGVGYFVVTSSGAAYGYHADNPVPLDEDATLRGNRSFPYAHHKKLVEEMLKGFRAEYPQVKQLVLRPGTILGRTTNNQITAMFEKPWVMGLRGSDSPFVVIWDEDVVGAIEWGLKNERAGVYNLAGDGTVTLREMARLMNKPYLPAPVRAVQGALRVLSPMGLSQYGPEQVNFLRYRPVLDNRRLKEEFGYVPKRTSQAAFETYLQRGKGR